MKSMIVAAVLGAAAAGCAGQDTGAVDGEAAPVEAAPVTGSSAVALRIEQAQRKLDVGRDAAGARADLEAALRDRAATRAERDEAQLALSRALEALGEGEGAIAQVEDLLAAHREDRAWSLQGAAEKRLRRLLTGTDAEPQRSPEVEAQVAPFARVLAPYFKPGAGGQIEARILLFGGGAEASDRLGTFNVRGALRDLKREACALCDDRVEVRTMSSRDGSWVGIAREREALGSALVVLYADLQSLIPARYDSISPLPTAEVRARLSRGEGVIAARERPGAPPVLLIAAPRWAQLGDVEEALSEKKALPTDPVAVTVKASLREGEIRGTVRPVIKTEIRPCYEALLQRAPGATGKFDLRFRVLPAGSVADAAVDVHDASLEDAAFEACLTAAMNGMTFPQATEQTTVVYPILVTPDQGGH